MPRLLRLPLRLISLAWVGGLAWAQTPVAPAPTPVFEEWTILMLEGKPCGFGSTITTEIATPAGPQYRTELQEEFVVKRMGTALKMSELSHIVEDAEGGVVSFDQDDTGMGTDIKSQGVREGDDLVITSRGQTQRCHVPRLSALGPEAVRRLSDAVPLRPGQKFSFATFITDYPQAPAIATGEVVGREPHEVLGVKRELWKITSTMSVMPGIPAVTWVDDQDKDVDTVITMPGLGEMHQVTSTRAECMKQPEGAEIFSTSLIQPQEALPPLDQQAQAVYRLTTTDLTQKLPLWNGGEQRVLSAEPGTSEIEVTVPAFAAADAGYALPHTDTPEVHAYLQPTAYLEAGSPEIQALAKQAVGGETNPVLAARRIEKFVRAYITKKDLNIGFASAQETARSREGDCTEHAVLCAAIGRAAGLPTRCVVGLGYVPPGEMEPTIAPAVDTKTGLFGFHMWAEAWIGADKWMAMDAALNGFDIGHIALQKSALADINPLVDLNMPILQLMQNLKITLVKTVSKRDYAAPAGILSPAAAAPVSKMSPGVD